jgi:hypothetical protein
MSEMIDRVAEVIRLRAIERGQPVHPVMVRHVAVAAIETMREPVAAQEAVMRDLLEREDRPPTKRWHWVWHEMIEAALSTKPQQTPGA